MSNKNFTVGYTKFHINLVYVLGNNAMIFIQHIIDRDKHRIWIGGDPNWSKRWFREIKLSRMSRYGFENCIKQLIKKGILSVDNTKKGMAMYEINFKTYNKFLEVFSCIDDPDVLFHFSSDFNKRERSIYDVTKKEIESLENWTYLTQETNTQSA